MCIARFLVLASPSPHHKSETLSLRKAKGEFNIFDRSSYQTGIFKDGGACGKEIYTLG